MYALGVAAAVCALHIRVWSAVRAERPRVVHINMRGGGSMRMRRWIYYHNRTAVRMRWSAASPCGGGGRAAERLCAGLRGEGSCVQQVVGNRERPAGLGNGAGVSPGFNFGVRRPIALQWWLCAGKAGRLSRVGQCGVLRQKVGLMCTRAIVGVLFGVECQALWREGGCPSVAV